MLGSSAMGALPVQLFWPLRLLFRLVLVELTKALIPACTRWKRCAKDGCVFCQCEKEEEEVETVDEDAERSEDLVAETAAVFRGPGLGPCGLTGDGMRLVTIDLPLMGAVNAGSKIDTAASEAGETEAEVPPPPYEPSSSSSVSITEASVPHTSALTPASSTTPPPTTPPRSSAHLFVLGTCYTTLNILNLASLWFTSQNLIFCNGPTNSFLKFFLLPVVLLSSTIHSTFGFSTYLVLIRNLWPERRIGKLKGLFGQAVRAMDQWLVVKGFTMLVCFPFVCLYLGIMAPVGGGVVRAMEWIQWKCCGDDESEKIREEEEGLLIASMERDTELGDEEVELMGKDMLGKELRRGDEIKRQERDDEGMKDEAFHQGRGDVAEPESERHKSRGRTQGEHQRTSYEVSALLPLSLSSTQIPPISTSRVTSTTTPEFVPENMAQIERIAFFSPESIESATIRKDEEGKCARCHHKVVKSKGDLCQACLDIRAEEINGFMVEIGK